MRNIFLFIRRYITIFTFLILQVVSLWFLFSYNRFHRAKFLGIANEVTGRINTQYNRVEDFFVLGEENRRVHRMNDSLLNLLPQNFMKPDTGKLFVRDSIPFDTLGNFRRYYFRSASVVYNTLNSQKNYIQINRGARHGIRDDMAVLSSEGAAVGIVVNVSANFSQVMSLLHVQQKVNASLKKSGDFGTIEWNGKDPRFLTLKGIPKSIAVLPGDSVLTSTYSFNFPPGYMIGTIAEVYSDKSTNFHVLKVKPAAGFYNLQQVFVVENLQYDEQKTLDRETRKKIENPKMITK
jgi:rod shape-determining protein MreC